MKRIAVIAHSLSISALLCAANAPAETSSEVAKKARNSDPNKLICETSVETGSRLARKRTCLTAAQWEEQRRQNRMDIERQQVQQGMKDPG